MLIQLDLNLLNLCWKEYSKDEIFQIYLNKIYYSDGVYGVKAAAKYYFNKDLKDLNLAESAYFSSLLYSCSKR